jgi:TRAP-type C4-dicarboxylate transport system permease small subunit
MKKVLATLFTFPVLAVSQVYGAGLTIDGIDGVNEEIPALITRLLNYAVGSAAVICVAILIASGYMYITASGDESKVEKATKSLTFAIIGLAICFIAVMLVNFVLTDILNPKAA